MEAKMKKADNDKKFGFFGFLQIIVTHLKKKIKYRELCQLKTADKYNLNYLTFRM